MLSVAAVVMAFFPLPGQNPRSITVGDDSYVAGPTLRLGRSISSERFSRDDRFLVYLDERVEDSYVASREAIRKGVDVSKTALMRLDIQRGTKETLYRPGPSETSMRIETVGTGGDALCSLAVGVPQGDLITWRAVYCPVGGSPRLVADGVKARSFQLATSASLTAAFILVCDPEKRARYLYITPTETRMKELPTTAFQGGFFLRTKAGNPVAALQGPAPDYAFLGNFELSFANGSSRRTEDLEAVDREVLPTPLIEYRERRLFAGNPAAGEAPINTITATSAKPAAGIKDAAVIQGAIGLLSASPSGLAFVYFAEDGYFLREMIKLDPPRQKPD